MARRKSHPRGLHFLPVRPFARRLAVFPQVQRTRSNYEVKLAQCYCGIPKASMTSSVMTKFKLANSLRIITQQKPIAAQMTSSQSALIRKAMANQSLHSQLTNRDWRDFRIASL